MDKDPDLNQQVLDANPDPYLDRKIMPFDWIRIHNIALQGC
jgi:hypothetical protein